MLSKPKKSLRQKQLEVLQFRGKLTEEERLALVRLQAGFNGEMLFYRSVKQHLSNYPVILYDLNLDLGGSITQIDCLMIFQQEIYLIEVKNYYGDFIFENDDFITNSRMKINNPLHQIDRSKLILSQLLKRANISVKISPYIIFINPEFHLYRAPNNPSLVFPSQIKRFLGTMNQLPSITNKFHREISALLHSLHLPSTHSSEYKYDYAMLLTGVFCNECKGKLKLDEKKKPYCISCQRAENIEIVIKKAIYEFNVLFPNEKITVQKMAMWMNLDCSKYYIRKVLSNNFILKGNGKSAYYAVEN